MYFVERCANCRILQRLQFHDCRVQAKGSYYNRCKNQRKNFFVDKTKALTFFSILGVKLFQNINQVVAPSKIAHIYFK